MRLTPLALGAAAALAASGACADERFCAGVGYDDAAAVMTGKVKADAGKVHFLKNGAADNACPSLAPDCQQKPYIVPGDLVVLGAKFGDYVCADYDGGRGDLGGWLPAAAIEPAPAETDPAAWIGDWKRVEAKIKIRKGDEGLTAEGDATFGALDPSRVKRGAVNVGEFSAPLLIKDGNASLIDKDADPKDSFACRLRFARSGSFLFVRDNMQCGGFNVSFSGLYRRAAK
jgi:hypothetical protein